MSTHESLCSWQSGVIYAIIEFELYAEEGEGSTVGKRLL